MSFKVSLMFQHFCAVRPSCHCQWAKATGPADSWAWHCQSTAEDGQRGALPPIFWNPFPDPGLLITFDNVLQEEQHGGPHGGAGGGRAERLAEELDDMERRVEQVENEDQPTLEKHTHLSPFNLCNCSPGKGHISHRHDVICGQGCWLGWSHCKVSCAHPIFFLFKSILYPTFFLATLL